MEAFEFLIQGLKAAISEPSPLPRYERIARHLAWEIRHGRLPPGTPLPRESELADLLGLSRQTVHLALATLARRGLLVRRRKVGTFVAASQLEQPLGLYSLFMSLTAQGHAVSSRLLGFRQAVEEEASPLLAGGAFEPVYELTRLRLVDGEPFAYESIYLPRALGEALPLDRVAREPLYSLLRERCGVTFTHAEETFQPVAVEPALATLLAVRAGDPALLVERVAYIAPNQPVELRRTVIRGDRYRVRVHLEGPLGEPPDAPQSAKGGPASW